jgi:hypothetical protein
MLAPGARTVTAARRGMGLAAARRFTNEHRVLNRATWSARHGSRMLLGLLITPLVPSGATIVLGADATVERRSGRKITAKGGDREAVRSSKHHVMGWFGLKWVAMMLLVPGPWSRRVWALPVRTTLCWPAEPRGRRRHKTSVDWGRQMRQHVRRWLPGRRLVWVVDGGCAAVALALACVNSRVGMVSRVRWAAALDHPPGRQPPGKRGPKPTKGKRPRRVQEWARRADTPWETGEVDWYGGQRKKMWVFSRTALGYTPGLPPGGIREVLVCDPKGKRRLAAFCWTNLQATPEQILGWVVRRWAGEVTFEEGRAYLGWETQRQWSDPAIARTTPVLLALDSLSPVLALQVSQGGQIPVSVAAWYHKAEPPFSACLTLVRRHLWRARYVVTSAAEAEFVQFPREAFERLLTGLP